MYHHIFEISLGAQGELALVFNIQIGVNCYLVFALCILTVPSPSEVDPKQKVFTSIHSGEVFKTSPQCMFEIGLGVQGEIVHASNI